MNILNLLSVNPRREATLTNQLKTQLVWLIATGEIKPGELLPSIRVMADHLGIHHLTVRAAYQQLEVEGMVVTRQGHGTTVLVYDPQRFAHIARETRSHTVGVLIPDLANPFYHNVLQGIEDMANKELTMLLVSSTHDDPLEMVRHFSLLSAKNVDGILVLSHEPDWLIRNGERPIEPNLPVVSLDCPGDPGDTVLLDLESAGWLATRHLMEHGHSRIGLISYTARIDNVLPLEDGYRRAMDEAGIKVRDEWIARVGGFDIEAGEAGARSLLSVTERPSAVFAITDLMAAGILRIANIKGLRIPEDLALVSFNDIPLAGLLNPPLTTVQAPAVEMGRQAMRLLQRRIRGEGGTPERILLPVSLVVRTSCGCGRY